METFVAEFARQGLGYLIAVFLAVVVIWQQKRSDAQYRQIDELQDKLYESANGNATKYTETIKEVIVAQKDALTVASMQKTSIDNLATALKDLVNRLAK